MLSVSEADGYSVPYVIQSFVLKTPGKEKKKRSNFCQTLAWFIDHHKKEVERRLQFCA